MAGKRDTTRYELRDKGKKVYVGITDDLDRRVEEHKNEGKRFTSARKVGAKVSRETAEDWEQKSIEAYKSGHRGRGPRYNKT